MAHTLMFTKPFLIDDSINVQQLRSGDVFSNESSNLPSFGHASSLTSSDNSLGQCTHPVVLLIEFLTQWVNITPSKWPTGAVIHRDSEFFIIHNEDILTPNPSVILGLCLPVTMKSRPDESPAESGS